MGRVQLIIDNAEMSGLLAYVDESELTNESSRTMCDDTYVVMVKCA